MLLLEWGDGGEGCVCRTTIKGSAFDGLKLWCDSEMTGRTGGGRGFHENADCIGMGADWECGEELGEAGPKTGSKECLRVQGRADFILVGLDGQMQG